MDGSEVAKDVGDSYALVARDVLQNTVQHAGLERPVAGNDRSLAGGFISAEVNMAAGLVAPAISPLADEMIGRGCAVDVPGRLHATFSI